MYRYLRPSFQPTALLDYPGRHGGENIEEAYRTPVTISFAELAHRLCLDKPDGTYSPEQGLDTCTNMRPCLDWTTPRVEIPENEPQISTEDPERSARTGHPFTTNVQRCPLCGGHCQQRDRIELSLLDKLTDSNGNLITDYAPTASSHIEASTGPWNAVQTGMRRVITDSSAKSIFRPLSRWRLQANRYCLQEDRIDPTMPSLYPCTLQPSRDCCCTVFPYGYAGTNAATLGKKVYEYYYRYTTLDQILDSGALGVSNVNIGD